MIFTTLYASADCSRRAANPMPTSPAQKMLPSEDPRPAERPALTFDRLYLRTRNESGPGVRAKITHNPTNAASELRVMFPLNHCAASALLPRASRKLPRAPGYNRAVRISPGEVVPFWSLATMHPARSRVSHPL